MDRVKPSPTPDAWKLVEIFITGVVLGTYLAMMIIIFVWATYKTDFLPIEKAKQDSALDDLSNILCYLKGMAVNMTSELERHNHTLDHLGDDVNE